MVLFPLLAGAGVLALLLAGGKKGPEKKASTEKKLPPVTPEGDLKVKPEDRIAAVEKAVKAVKAKDWQQAAAQALASGSAKAVRSIAEQMAKEGLSKEAKSLLGAFAELVDSARRQHAKEADKSKPAKPAAKPA